VSASSAVLAGLVFNSASNFGISVSGGDSGDTVTTGGGDDVLNGLGGADNLSGGLGADLLDGGVGSDTMTGGDGNDTFIVDNVGDQAIETNLLGGIDEVQSSVTFTLGSNVDNLVLTGLAAINGTGNALGNAITGNNANNTLNGMGGADTMTGGGGDDVYVVDNTGDTVVEGSSMGTDRVSSSINYTLGANVENLTLTGAATIGFGNGLNNLLLGNANNNTLNGAAGADEMRGGAGDDIYVVDDAGDVVIEGSGNGNDRVSSSVTFTLGANIEELSLTGSANINGTGNGQANIVLGNSGNNQLNGASGADEMRGGAGDDTYFVDNVGDVVIEAASNGTDTVNSSVSFTLGASVENLVLTGISAISGTGNNAANTITGNIAANTLSGSVGADMLSGGGGGDDLFGGSGNDDLTGDSGADKFRFDTTLSASNNVDDILDFNVTDDSLYLDRDIFTGIAADGTLAAGAFRAGTLALDGDDRILYDAATGHILYDADGIGGAAAILFATVTPGLVLTSADFVGY